MKNSDGGTSNICRVALYARYSSDLQSASSIDDQIRVCTSAAKAHGWKVVETYADRALSGASMLRPQLQQLIADARSGQFEVVLAEALDRLSRDQEDIAGLFKRLRFSGVRLFTCSEGEISELHVGLKGTMNALFLKDLAAKTHRGLEGRIRQGLSAGGLTFGYDVSGGEGGARGGRRINAPQAVVVERIFREFSVGKSPLAISKQLNEELIPGPGGRPWLDTTIRGHAVRGTGILRNELYIGRLIWNRLRYAKDPDTGKRLSRLNPSSEWVIEDVPDLRIIDQDLWEQVAGRLAVMRATPRVTKQRQSRFWEHRRPKHFTTGRIFCGGCGNAMAVIGKDYFGCNHARRRGTCGNRAAVRRSEIDRLVLDGLKKQLMAPDLLKAFIDSFHKEVNRQRGEQTADRRAKEHELPALNRKIHSLVDAIASGVRTSAIVSALEEAEARKVAIEAQLAAPEPTPVRLHPALGDLYRQRVTDLHIALAAPKLQAQATEIIRSLIDRIVVAKRGDGLEIELIGDLAAMVEIAQGQSTDNKKTALVRAALSATDRRSVKVVAGAGFEPTTFRL